MRLFPRDTERESDGDETEETAEDIEPPRAADVVRPAHRMYA